MSATPLLPLRLLALAALLACAASLVTSSASARRSGSPSRFGTRTPSARPSQRSSPSTSTTFTRTRSVSTSASRLPTTSRSTRPSTSRSVAQSATPSGRASFIPSPAPCAAGSWGAPGACRPCPLGSFCPPDAAAPYACPAGRFGAAQGLETPDCSGACSAPPGYGCAAGSTSAANATMCQTGRYCPGGAPASALPCTTPALCTAPGLSAEPSCVWNVSILAGNGNRTPFVNGAGSLATFYLPGGVAEVPDGSGNVYAADSYNNVIRLVTPVGFVSTFATGFFRLLAVAVYPATGDIYAADQFNNRVSRTTTAGVTTTLAGGGGPALQDGVGTTSRFWAPRGIAVDSAGVVFVADGQNNCIRRINARGNVTTLAGNGSFAPFANGIGTTLVTFSLPTGVAVDTSGNVFVGDSGNYRVRLVTPLGNVSTFAGSGNAIFADGQGTAASFNSPYHLSFAPNGNLFVAEFNIHRIRMITPLGLVSTLFGGGTLFDGYGTTAKFVGPMGVAIGASGVVTIGGYSSYRMHRAECVLCPPGFFCPAGVPVPCSAGTYNALSGQTSAAACLPCAAGAWCAAGAAIGTPCPAGTFNARTGAATVAACLPCPGGHYCPLGTGSTALLACGVGNFCPDASSAPRPCPLQLPPTGGWGAQLVQGPAFVVETAHCLNHCYWNYTAGTDGLLSKC